MSSHIALLLFAVYAATGFENSGTKYQIYDWSETAPNFRVSKKLLTELPIPSVQIENYATAELALSQSFVKVFRLTEREIQQIDQVLTEAQYRYRVLEAKRLKPISAAEFGSMLDGEKGDQFFNFEVLPLLEEGASIRKDVERAVNSALGQERATLFIANGKDLHYAFGELGGTKYSFRFPAREPGTVYRLRYSGGPGGHVDEFERNFDLYAQESLKPFLAHWRKKVKTGPRKEREAASGKRAITAYSGEPWDEKAEYVDLPKGLLLSFTFPGLMPGDTLNPKVAALLGLNSAEESRVMALYRQMGGRFEEAEREHFTRVEAGKNKFILRAFPNESAEIKRRWSTEVNGLLGEQRGDLLQRAFQRDWLLYSAQEMDRELRRHYFEASPHLHWRTLWDRGTKEVHFEFNVSGSNIEYKITSNSDGSYESSGTSKTIPEEWQYLLTPKTLDARVLRLE